MSSISRCNRDVMELRWENGQLGLHGEELNPAKSWGGDHTLESIVQQATSNLKWEEEGGRSRSRSRPMQATVAEVQMQNTSGKRVRSVEESASARVDPDATMITWNSLDSPRSFKAPRIHHQDYDHDHDSLYQDFSENQEGTKDESCRSQSSARRSRAAAIHNLSERRRRDRINEKMKALQKLVPNASKTDKASMLDEVIEYLKQLQAQVHMMSNARNMPQIMMPLGMQQQLQMSLLARMGMGMNVGMMGMGMLDVNNLARNPFPAAPLIPPLASTAQFVSPPPFAMPPPTPLKPNVDVAASVSSSMPNFNDAYNTFLAQSMNMEILNKMYRQQQSSQQPSKRAAVSLSLPNDAQGQGG